MTEHYEVFALKYAEKLNRTRRENFIFDDDHDAPCPIDFFIWVIRNENRTILVDTGYDAAEAKDRDRPILLEPSAALTEIGLKPGDIEDVIVTHLHFDHAGGLEQFPDARLHMQAAEMAYATGPCMCHDALKMPFTARHVCDAVKRLYSGKVAFYEGDAQIAPGITVHEIGGHSKGLQCVRVETAHGPMVLASDATHFYENFEKGKPFPIVADVEAMLKGFDTMRSLVEDHSRIVPGHDPLVLSRYPTAFESAGCAVRRLDLPRLDV